MNTSTVKERFVRTFLSLLAGSAVTWGAINWASDWKVGITIVGWGLVTIVLASTLAAFVAARDILQSTANPYLRALATFLEAIIAGVPVAVITDAADLANLGRVVLSTLGVAFFGALSNFALNAHGNIPSPTPPAP